MRKVLMVSILSLLATGCECTCETLRRVEVWKQHKFFAPNEPVVVSPTDPCAPAATPRAEPGCGMGAAEIGCGGSTAELGCSGGAAEVVSEQPTSVALPVTPGPEETISTEEINGVLKQP